MVIIKLFLYISQEEQKILVDSMYTPIDDAQAEEIMNS